MTLLLSILLCQSFATATVETRVELRPDADNRPSIQSLLDNAAEGSVVRIPAGTWTTNSHLSVSRKLTLEGPATGTATLILIASNTSDDVIRVGDYHANVKVNGVTIRRLTLEVAGRKDTGIFNCLDVFGEDLLCEDVTFIGSPHEGVVVAGKRATFNRCKGQYCGKGNDTYQQSTAAFNSHAHPTIYTDCETDYCGQGFEVDGHGSKVLRCTVKNPSINIVGPLIGVNIGSTGFGINDVEVSGCTIIGYPTAVQFGNGIGRLAGINIHHNVFDGGEVSGMGGLKENKATDADYPPGPDTSESHCDSNLFIIRGNSAFGLNTGPSDGGNPNEFGREPWTFDDNTVWLVTMDEHNPLVYVGGNYTAPFKVRRTRFIGANLSPSRGMIATFTNGVNVAVKGQPNLTMEGNTAFTADGKQRPVIVKVEGRN
jgi:hypothetical protein